MLIVIKSCPWSVNLPINLSPNLSKIIIKRLYFADFSYHSSLLLPKNGLPDKFPLVIIHILLTLLWPFINVGPKFVLLTCILILLLNLIAAFCQSPQLSSNGGIIINWIEKKIDQWTLIMDNPQGGQFLKSNLFNPNWVDPRVIVVNH